jgi:hypothetical protein
VAPPLRRDASRSHTWDDRLEAKADKIAERLERLIDDGSDSDFLKAMAEWMNRTHGRPKESVEVERKESRLDRVFDGMSTEELEQFVCSRRHLRAVNDEEAAEN